ncbi:hypothetical protein HOLleu_01873 [Holothuria leucospilota]|uniref:Uncharacterized protein n=1 Tax=Holothuria leucospilota TaxID=206669 RepID=A0A9Q1HJG6_HOLLE|nr:hypothetical protein HOLleu_01873 [Holothuria leucospilota]
MRKEHMVLSALWFGNDRPKMETFFKPFVGECNKLSQDGFLWTHGIIEPRSVLSKVYPIICCADAQARCMLQNMVQFNGYFGCGFCKHKGEYDNDSNSLKYPYCIPHAPLRTNAGTKSDSIEAEETGMRVNGLKGVSILSFLFHFNIVAGFIPDYMHAVCLGTVRRFFFMWIDPTNADKPYYLGQRLQLLCDRISQIKPTKEIQRVPRPLDVIKYWKASEWRSFLFYSLPILSGVLPPMYLAHWAMLVQSMFHLCSTNISHHSLRMSEFLIGKFLIFVEPLYGKKEMTYNIHILSHMPDCVRNWGPLWCTSSFMFESYNGYLKNLFNDTRAVPQQIFTNLCRLQFLHRHYVKAVSPTVEDFIQRVLFHKKVTKSANYFQLPHFEIVTLGTPEDLKLTAALRLALQDVIGERIISVTAKCYKRFIIDNVLFSTTEYSSKFKRTDSLIEFNDHVAEILYLIIFKNHNCRRTNCECEEHVLLVLRELLTVQRLKCIYGGLNSEIGCSVSFIRQVRNGRIYSTYPHNQFNKAMDILYEGKRFVVTLPNRLEE